MNDDDESKIAKFSKGFNPSEPTELMLGVSMGSGKQTGKELQYFVDLANRSKQKIKKLKILVVAYLHRHYVGEEEAKKYYEQWLLDNKHILEKLQIPYEIIEWKDATNNDQYRNDLEFVKELYKTDTGFKYKVDKIAKSHKHKADHETAVNYLLEECAYFKSLKSNFTYPAIKLNDACVHIVNNYNPNFHYKPYSIFETKKASAPALDPSRNNNGYHQNASSRYSSVPRRNSLSFLYEYESISPQEFLVCCAQFSLLMEKVGLHSVEAKEGFFKKFLKNNQDSLDYVLSDGGNAHESKDEINKGSNFNC